MKLILVRHGATTWSETGRHTSRTDLPLTTLGRHQADGARARVLAAGASSADLALYSSPMLRARATAELVMQPDRSRARSSQPPILIDERLREFDYGEYEGLTTPEIHRIAPGWTVFDGCPGGESLADVEARVDSFLADARASEREVVVVFSHGHLSRILAARTIGQPGGFALHLGLDTAAVSVIADLRDGPAITLWNDVGS